MYIVTHFIFHTAGSKTSQKFPSSENFRQQIIILLVSCGNEAVTWI